MGLTVVSRKAWGARYGRRGSASIGRVDDVVIHHTYIPDVPSGDPAEERSAVRAVERYHAVNLEWSAGPGYPWLVGQSGLAYEGVGWWRRGVHTQGMNSASVAICFLINGDVRLPTDAAWQAAHELVQWGIELGAIASRYSLWPHAAFANKSCPGSRVRPRIEIVRRGVKVKPKGPDMADGVLVFDEDGEPDPDVRELQDTLLWSAKRFPGFNPGWAGGAGQPAMKSDGVYGPRTQRAVHDCARRVNYHGTNAGRRAHPNLVSRVRGKAEAIDQAAKLRRELAGHEHGEPE